jgi:hypothetical protein
MNANHQTSKAVTAVTAVSWLIAVGLVVGLAVWRAAPKRAEATSAECYARIQALAALTKAYAGKHDGRRPTSIEDFRALAPNMTPEAWFCPSDQRRSQLGLKDWESFTPADASYRFAGSTDAPANGDSEMIRCAIHGHVVYHNGKTANADN